METLAHYTIIEKIGEGGMGEVYRARDDRLKREVAIKVLPELFTADPERLGRFEREAQVLAQLNHPNVAAIYGLEQDGGKRFLSLELVPGKDLAQVQAEIKGPFALDDAIGIAGQIADAVEAAHEMGIVHRDLKPSNVMLTPDGTIKVLDFGLAKAVETEVSDSSLNLSNSPTLTGLMTEANVILGTAAYMSPEQARGKKVDKRADVWSFGVIVFELLTGEQLFQGETVSDTLAGVLKTDIELDKLPADTPHHVRMLLERCLTRDPKMRLRDIGEARIVLAAGEDVGLPDGPGDDAPRTGRGLPPALAGVAALIAAVVGLGVGAFLLKPGAPELAERPMRQLSVDPGQGDLLPNEPVLSPDGTRLAYLRGGSIWVRDLDKLEPKHLDETSGVMDLFWSPDGERIGYLAGSQILTVDPRDGSPVVVTNTTGMSANSGAGGAWSAEHGILFTTGVDHVYRVSDRGGDPSVFFESDSTETDFHEPSLLPDGSLLTVPHMEGGIFGIYHLADGKRHEVVSRSSERLYFPAWSPTGHVLYERRGDNPGVWAVPYDPDSRTTLGEPFLLVANGGNPSADRHGTVSVLLGSRAQDIRIVEADRQGKVLRRISDERAFDFRLALSPDGGRLALTQVEEGDSEIWIYDLRRGTSSRATFDGGFKTSPAWSYDGRWLCYYGGVGGVSNLHVSVFPVDGSAPPESLYSSTAGTSFIPGSEDLLLSVHRGDTSWDLVVGERKPGGETRLLVEDENWQYDARVSPDGKYMAYVSREGGQDQIYMKRFPDGSGKWQVSVNGGQWPRWTADSKRLLFAQGNSLVEVDVETSDPPELGVPRVLFERKGLGFDIRFQWEPHFDITADAERIYFFEPVIEDATPTQVVLLQDWNNRSDRTP